MLCSTAGQQPAALASDSASATGVRPRSISTSRQPSLGLGTLAWPLSGTLPWDPPPGTASQSPLPACYVVVQCLQDAAGLGGEGAADLAARQAGGVGSQGLGAGVGAEMGGPVGGRGARDSKHPFLRTAGMPLPCLSAPRRPRRRAEASKCSSTAGALPGRGRRGAHLVKGQHLAHGRSAHHHLIVHGHTAAHQPCVAALQGRSSSRGAGQSSGQGVSESGACWNCGRNVSWTWRGVCTPKHLVAGSRADGKGRRRPVWGCRAR